MLFTINGKYWNGNTSRAGVANMRFDILGNNEKKEEKYIKNGK
jgi:hypothetical protein